MKTHDDRSNADGWRGALLGVHVSGVHVSGVRVPMAALLGLMLVLTAGCGSSPDVVNDTDIRDLDHANLLVMMQGGHDADRMVESDGAFDGAVRSGDVRLVDVRAFRHFEQGHLPGAINLFLPDLHAGDARLTEARSIVVYAQTWQDSLGPAAAKRLITLGYDNVYLYRGGVELWIARGGQLEDGE